MTKRPKGAEMKAILAKKLAMTRIFDQEGRAIAVTAVEAGPCYVSQIKSKEKEGYDAIQLAYQTTKKIKKPQIGHLEKMKNEKLKVKNFKYLREFRVSKVSDTLKIGDEIKVDIFQPGDEVTVSGISKGKGFAGTVKRHHFRTGPKSHGSDDYRTPGSIGAQQPQRVIKGKRMAGRMGNEKVTRKKIKIIDIEPENNLLLLKGALPGAAKGLLEIYA